MRKNILIATFIAFICGCASTEANLQRESARSIGKGLSPDQIAITNVNRGMTDVSWTADTPKGKFKCFADDMVRRVNCLK